MRSPHTVPAVSREDVARRLARLANELAVRGSLRSEHWSRSVLGVARHVFVPGYWYEDRAGSERWRWIDGGDPDEHAGWLDSVYSDHDLVTGLARHRSADGVPEQQVVSCSTRPSLVLQMLGDLDPQPGEHVLEIGTGTGYSTALMCHALGDRNVASVDIEPSLIDVARQRLAAIGHCPRLAAANGADGLPDEAPFDHLIATCSITEVPAAWIEQVRPGGAIIANLRGPLMIGAQVRLTVYGDGTAIGPFLSSYGSLTSLRHSTATLHDSRTKTWTRASGPVASCTTALDPMALLRDRAWGFVAQIHMPDIIAYASNGAAVEIITSDGSWVRVDNSITNSSGRTVLQAGPRRIWDTLGKIRENWESQGRPTWERYGLMISPAGTAVWLDEPGNPISHFRAAGTTDLAGSGEMGCFK